MISTRNEKDEDQLEFVLILHQLRLENLSFSIENALAYVLYCPKLHVICNYGVELDWASYFLSCIFPFD